MQQEEDEQQRPEEIYGNDDDDACEEEDRARELHRWRQLREEQDRAYAECQQLDQQKCAERARRQEVYLFKLI